MSAYNSCYTPRLKSKTNLWEYTSMMVSSQGQIFIYLLNFSGASGDLGVKL